MHWNITCGILQQLPHSLPSQHWALHHHKPWDNITVNHCRNMYSRESRECLHTVNLFFPLHLSSLCIMLITEFFLTLGYKFFFLYSIIKCRRCCSYIVRGCIKRGKCMKGNWGFSTDLAGPHEPCWNLGIKNKNYFGSSYSSHTGYWCVHILYCALNTHKRTGTVI